MRKMHVSSELTVDRLRLVHKDQLLLIECGSADLPHAKLLQVTAMYCDLKNKCSAADCLLLFAVM